MPINQRNAGFISATYQPLQVANAPTIGAATAGDASASVAFTAPANVGGSAISAYYAVSDPDRITGSGASSPVTVSGLTNGTAYTFSVWALNTYGPSPFSGASGSVSPAAPRGVFSGGQTNSTIDYITITTTGNAIDFGDLTVSDNTGTAYGGTGSSTRGLIAGGAQAAYTNTISFITIATVGNSSDFGDLLTAGDAGASGCNSTRSVFLAGYYFIDGDNQAKSNVIQYVTTATTGNAIDFGDYTVAENFLAGCSSPTRTVAAGGGIGTSRQNIAYVTTATLGNAVSFGNLAVGTAQLAACSSATRGLFAGGMDASVEVMNTIQYITIATTGNATDFGDLTVGRRQVSGCSSSLRGVFAGGFNGLNVIDYVTIASTGNATDFGDLTTGRGFSSATSSANGGLQ
jgi:hypothetical protein